MASPISDYHKFETYKTLFDKSNGKFQTNKFFYHLALSEDMHKNNTKSQEKITLGPEVLIFLGAVIGMMILIVVIEKIASWFKDL